VRLIRLFGGVVFLDMKTVAAFFLVLLAGGVSAEELPDLAPLSSGNFEKRQASQKAVNDWVISNH